MLHPYNSQATLAKNSSNLADLQLLLFVDERPSCQEQSQKLQAYLFSLKQEYDFEFEVIDIGKQPHLAEHFRLITTPTLVKISPEPRQALAGSDLIAQLKKWWPFWEGMTSKQEIVNQEASNTDNLNSEQISLKYSVELMQLSDEIFRLKQEKEELLEQLKFKDQVLAMLAHDLRSPLTAASIALETLELAQNYQNQEKYLSLKDLLHKQVKNQFQIMNRMIGDILQASKSGSGKLRIQRSQFNIAHLCDEIITEFLPRFQEKSQTFKQDIPQDLPKLYADRELIRQVIVNLLDNAFKYTPEYGKINLSVLHRTTQTIQVSVSDTGLGIPEEKRETIFQGHFRLQRDEAKEGYGIGLYLCRQVICAHYGQIWVDSVPNQGSCFNFTLPVYR